MKLVMTDDLRPYLPDIADLIRECLPGLHGIESHQAIAVIDADEVTQAVVLYGSYTPQDIQMHIASRSQVWCKRGVLRGLFHFPFVQLGVNRSTAMIPKKNRVARKFVERLGYRHEGTHPGGAHDFGTICSYGLLKENCKWL